MAYKCYYNNAYELFFSGTDLQWHAIQPMHKAYTVARQ
jgi:hypothetical protein